MEKEVIPVGGLSIGGNISIEFHNAECHKNVMNDSDCSVDFLTTYHLTRPRNPTDAWTQGAQVDSWIMPKRMTGVARCGRVGRVLGYRIDTANQWFHGWIYWSLDVLGYDLEFRVEQEALLGAWADVTTIK